jgi:hypothetical protein
MLKCENCMPGQGCFVPDSYYVFQTDEYGHVSGEDKMMQEIYQRGPIACGIAFPTPSRTTPAAFSTTRPATRTSFTTSPSLAGVLRMAPSTGPSVTRGVNLSVRTASSASSEAPTTSLSRLTAPGPPRRRPGPRMLDTSPPMRRRTTPATSLPSLRRSLPLRTHS